MGMKEATCRNTLPKRSELSCAIRSKGGSCLGGSWESQSLEGAMSNLLDVGKFWVGASYICVVCLCKIIKLYTYDTHVYVYRFLNVCYHSIQMLWKVSPGCCGSVDWALAFKPKSHWFDSQSGHMPGFWARSPIGGVWEAADWRSMSLSYTNVSLPLLLPPPLSKNK